MAEALPAYPFEPGRYIGTVVEIGPSYAKVNLPSAADPDGALRHGERLGGSGVGEFVVLDAGDVAIFARLTQVRIPERDRLAVQPKVGDRRDAHPVGTVQLLTSVPLDGAPVERGVTRFPRVGARVYSLDPALVTWVVRRASEAEGEPIGSAQTGPGVLLDLAVLPGTGSARVRVTPERLFGRHCAILGATGSGKSWSLARIMECVAKFNAKVLLLDATGEYYGLDDRVTHLSLGGSDKPAGTARTSFPYDNLEERDLFALFQPAGKVQGPRLREAFKSLKLARILGDEHDLVNNGVIQKAGRSKEPFEAEYARHAASLDIPLADFDIWKLPEQVTHECIWPSAFGGDSSKWGNVNDSDFSMCTTLIARIESDLTSPQLAPVFQPGEASSLLQEIENFLLDGDAAVLRVSLRNLAFDRNVREIVANGIGRNLLRLAREDKRFRERPLVVCVDEAHQFLNKELGDEFSRYPLDAFDLIAKEGRKYSLSICLATQRPRDIPNSVIGQMGTLMVHRLTNDKDRAMVEGAAGEMDRSAAEFLPTLAPGQALLLGVEFPIPLTIQISPPGAKPDSRGPNFQKHWGRRSNDATEDGEPLISEAEQAGV